MNIYKEITNYSLPRNDNVECINDNVFCDLFNIPVVDVVLKLFNTFSYCPWIFSLIGSVLVGLCGIFPLLVIPIEEGENLKFGDGANRLRVLLSFAVGGLLGDVFLHLLPEAWENGLKSDTKSHPSLFSGVWVLIGMLVFVIVEKLSTSLEQEPKPIIPSRRNSQQHVVKANGGTISHGCEQDKQIKELKKNSVYVNGNHINNNNLGDNNNHFKMKEKVSGDKREHYHISGYLNLMANSVDNFTHGLAIGGSFSISFKMGVLSTFAILVHELPHEVGDFAILLKSGFSRWDAAKAQICTAFAGIMGSMIAVIFGTADSIESKTSWILPFTAGGFLHIALVTVLPELVHEESKSESCKQLGSLVCGIAIMAFLIVVFE